MRCFIAILLAASTSLHAAENVSLLRAENTSLLLWLDANNVEQTDANVTRWVDSSSYENHISAMDDSQRPVWIPSALGDKPAIRFKNARLQRDIFNGVPTGDQPLHVFVVFDGKTIKGRSPRLLDIQNRPARGEIDARYYLKRKGFWLGYQDFKPETVGQLRLGIWYGQEAPTERISFDAKPHIAEVTYAGRQQWSFFDNGVSNGFGNFKGDTMFLGFELGARLAVGQTYNSDNEATAFDGDISEIIVFNRSLSFFEQQQIGAYLAQKYQLETDYSDDEYKPLIFEDDIVPLLTKYCVDCHSTEDPKADLDITSLLGVHRGSISGAVVQPENAPASMMMQLVGSNQMPPPDYDLRPTAMEIQTLRRWIDEGCTAREPIDIEKIKRRVNSDHWAFQKLHQPAVPDENDKTKNAVDRYIQNKLDAHSLAFSKEADKETLIRRAYLDLIGLQPSPQQVDVFLNDESPDAWETVVDGLLASQHFGERWGRHWLDNAGYSDIISIDNDQNIVKVDSVKWKYRDYVVQSFNEDTPFPIFLTEQLAGDELSDWRNAEVMTDQMRRQLIATGFLRNAPDDTDQNELNIFSIRYNTLHRTGETVSSNLLGLTMRCCKCHNHKFEPISQQDYYQFTAAFAPAFSPTQWLQPQSRIIDGFSTKQVDAFNAELSKLREAQATIGAKAQTEFLEAQLNGVPSELREDVKAIRAVAADSRDEIQKYLASKFPQAIEIGVDAAVSQQEDSIRAQYSDAAARISEIEKQIAEGKIQAVYDVDAPPPVHVLRRGEYGSPAAEVHTDIFDVLSEGRDFEVAESTPMATSGRRLTVARKLTDWDSAAGALVLRVRANRIWLQLFGKGIVPTADNLGVSGLAPSHPELLEWLSVHLAKTGSQKSLIKQIVMSQTYKQEIASDSDSANYKIGIKVDPENTLLWQQRLRRLESEIIRDCMLTASGRLDTTQGGYPVMTHQQPDGSVKEDRQDDTADAATWRRSMYLLQRRNYHLSMLQVFDQPLLNEECLQRSHAAVVNQSLMMLNNPFVQNHAEFMAMRVRKDIAGDNASDQLNHAFRLVLVRAPVPEEMDILKQTYEEHYNDLVNDGTDADTAQRQSLTHICHTLLNTSEFLYRN